MAEEEKTDFVVGDEDYANVAFIFTVIFLVMALLAYSYFTYLYVHDENARTIMVNIPKVFFITPAAVGGFIIVALFRKAEGLIKFEALGFKFEGASGPIVMWILCFLAVVVAIKVLG